MLASVTTHKVMIIFQYHVFKQSYEYLLTTLTLTTNTNLEPRMCSGNVEKKELLEYI